MTPLQGLVVLTCAHVVIPAAIAVMFCSLLLFVLEIRGIFVGGGDAVRVIGCLFVAAVVLIVRYGRVYGERDRQAGYILALAAAVSFALLSMHRMGGVLPPAWSGALAGPSLAAAVVGVWWLAARTTRHLDLEFNPRPKAPNLYGLELARHARRLWRAQMALPPPGSDDPEGQREAARLLTEDDEVAGPGAAAPEQPRALRWLVGFWEGLTGTGENDPDQDPTAEVARLALPALAIFAVGEPLILRAQPEAGSRAMAAMMAWFLSAGVLLAAGGALGAFRRVHRAGGRTQPFLIPARAGLAALALACALTASLGAPGVSWRGSGELTPESLRGEGDGGDGEEPPEKKGEEGKEAEGEQEDGDSTGDSSAGGGLEGALAQLAALGAKVAPALFAIAALFAAWLLWRGRRFFTAWGARWLGWLRAARGSGLPPPQPPRVDPLAGLERAARLPPAESLEALYGIFDAVCADRGHPRPPRQTPLEFLRGLPAELRVDREAIGELTRIYVAAAYTAAGVGEAERDRAVAAVRRIGAG